MYSSCLIAAWAARAWVDEQERNGCVNWPDWERKLEQYRRDVARLIGARSDEIAYVNSTTQGIGLVAEGFPWREGDNVVTASEEYPSNLYPWMNLADRGVSLRQVESRDQRRKQRYVADADVGRYQAVMRRGFEPEGDGLAELGVFPSGRETPRQHA